MCGKYLLVPASSVFHQQMQFIFMCIIISINSKSEELQIQIIMFVLEFFHQYKENYYKLHILVCIGEIPLRVIPFSSSSLEFFSLKQVKETSRSF